MDLISDILLGAAAIGAGVYCFVLGRRLNRFNDLEKGVGGAVAVLSVQVDDLTKTLNVAQAAAGQSARELEALTGRAEETARQLELQIASLHDVTLASQTPAASEQPKPPVQPPKSEGEPMFMRHRAAGGMS